MICHHCKTNKVNSKKRPLCKVCYSELHKNKMLDMYPLLPNDEFINSLISKYGEGIVEDLINIVNSNLKTIGDKYGFTREYARQIFKKLFNVDYTVIVKEKKIKRKEFIEREIELRKDPRNKIKNYPNGCHAYVGAIGEEKVLNILLGLGYSVKPYMKGRTFDLIVNEYKVDIKTCTKPTVTSSSSKTKTFKFQISEEQKLGDFIICYAASINKYFIVPTNKLKNGRFLFIPEKESSEWVGHNGSKIKTTNKWYKYLDAWDLLRKKTEEYSFSMNSTDSSTRKDEGVSSTHP
jgi:hypothetical protein